MTHHSRNVRAPAILIALTVIVVGGFLAGRAAVELFAKGSERSPTPVTPQTQAPAAPPALATPAVATRQSQASRFPRSREGAAAAAASHSIALVKVAFADPTERQATYRQITTTRARQGLLELAASSQRVLGTNLGTGGSVVLRAAPMGYRIVSFTPERAVVDVWSVGVSGGSNRPPVASWESTLVTLVWQQRSWRLDNFQNGPGLTPAATSAKVNPQEVLDDHDKYRGYDNVWP